MGGGRAARNKAVIAGPDGRTARYAKIHPFTYAGEDEHYAAGDQFLTVDDRWAAGQRLRLLRPALRRRILGLAPDTDLYVVPANWPEPRREHWRALLRARAIENQAYVVGVNRVGTVGTSTYVGDSAIIDPLGARWPRPVRAGRAGGRRRRG